MLTGDINLNIRTDPNKIDLTAEKYLSMAAYHGLLPTHIFVTRELSGTCLDHFLLKTKSQSHTAVCRTTLTDHNTIILGLVSQTDNVCKPDQSFKFTKINYNTLKLDLENISFDRILTSQDPNYCMTFLASKIQLAIDNNSISVAPPRRKRILKPWITPGMLKCVQNRDKLHYKLRKNPKNQILKLTYTRYRNYCNMLLKKLKIIMIKNLLIKPVLTVKNSGE